MRSVTQNVVTCTFVDFFPFLLLAVWRSQRQARSKA